MNKKHILFTIGIQTRFIIGAIAVGIWQSSFYAGLAAYVLLLTLKDQND